MDEARIRKIQVEAISRVEGEGGLHVTLKGGVIEEVQLSIYEPPRFFEAFLRDRPLEDVPDITARICGICPVAYQMSSVHALERRSAFPSHRRSAGSGGCFTAGNGSKAIRCTCTCSMRPISSAWKAASKWPVGFRGNSSAGSN